MDTGIYRRATGKKETGRNEKAVRGAQKLKLWCDTHDILRLFDRFQDKVELKLVRELRREK